LRHWRAGDARGPRPHSRASAGRRRRLRRSARSSNGRGAARSRPRLYYRRGRRAGLRLCTGRQRHRYGRHRRPPHPTEERRPAELTRDLAVGSRGADMAKYLEGTDAQKNRAYSPAVVTEGGRIVWLAGQVATVDGDGKDISGNFEAQTHRGFALMDQTLRRVGGTLADLVTMTVFIKEPRHGDRFVEIRKDKFQE